MIATVGTDPEQAAADLLEVLPLWNRWLRAKIRSHEPSWSLPQLHALGYVRLNPGTSLSELAGYLGIGLPTASTLVSRLVNAGYMQREEDPLERRRVSLTLTDQGLGRFDDALELAREELAGRLGRLSRRELSRITAAMTHLRRVLNDDPARPLR
jgi:DNA-binding MarR family transcriptional regulator